MGFSGETKTKKNKNKINSNICEGGETREVEREKIKAEVGAEVLIAYY